MHKLPLREVYASYIVHEIAHAVFWQSVKVMDLPVTAHEYVAHAFQIASLDPKVRNSFLEAFPGAVPQDLSSFELIFLYMAPLAFSARAYRHFEAQHNQCEFLIPHFLNHFISDGRDEPCAAPHDRAKFLGEISNFSVIQNHVEQFLLDFAEMIFPVQHVHPMAFSIETRAIEGTTSTCICDCGESLVRKIQSELLAYLFPVIQIGKPGVEVDAYLVLQMAGHPQEFSRMSLPNIDRPVQLRALLSWIGCVLNEKGFSNSTRKDIAGVTHNQYANRF